MMDRTDQKVLKMLASKIPAGAECIEIGSYCGGSAKLILNNAPDSIHLTCFDSGWLESDSITDYSQAFKAIFGDNKKHLQTFVKQWNFDRYPNTWKFASEYLRFNSNVKLVPCNAPYDVKWNTPVDFVFEDSFHSNPQLKDNIQFWWPLIKNGGVLVGHDFSIRFQDVIKEALNFTRNNFELHVKGTIWWVEKI